MRTLYRIWVEFKPLTRVHAVSDLTAEVQLKIQTTQLVIQYMFDLGRIQEPLEVSFLNLTPKNLQFSAKNLTIRPAYLLKFLIFCFAILFHY